MISKEEVYYHLVERIIQRDEIHVLLDRSKDAQWMVYEVVAKVAWISPTNPTLRLRASGVDKESALYYCRAFFAVSQVVYDYVKNEPVLISYKDLLDYKTLMDM